MKHIYFDVSAFIRKCDEVLWQIISSALDFNCNEEHMVVYICSDLKNEGFHILDKDMCINNSSDMTCETVPFNFLESGSVYFDVITSDIAFPQRSYLYPILKKSGVQIVSFIKSTILDIISDPENYKDNSIISALDCMGSVISYSSCAVFENEKDIETLSSLCVEMMTNCPECDIINRKSFIEKLCNTSKEYGSVLDTHVTQMVVLTARNNDIMKSLPYIEAFMPFITELVVCCPLENVLPFKEEYKGKLALSFITDDDLLGGDTLPSDHQARNFFLRCKLIEQDILNDVFIMTDDDYRPMKPITEDVFIKNRRYQGYYFYDIRDWQGSYNNYTSFDKGAFKTRDFLIQNGYPTLQYSSHQPQVIDKRIFKEMLAAHDGIENNPYDEWSTYFNYGFYHYPDKFKPCKSISMCWPGDFASWDIHHVSENYFFENYYEELYSEGQIFEIFSETFSENTEQENEEKSAIYRKKALRQLREKEVFLQYRKEYNNKMGEYPSIVICYDDKSKVKLHIPEYISLAIDSWTRIPIAVENAVYKNAGENSELFVSYHFINSLGVPILNSPEISIKTGDSCIMLPIRTPKTELQNTLLTIRVILRGALKENSSEKYISEKSMKLMLTKIDEVDYV